MANEEKALAIKGGGFEIIDPKQLPEIDPDDLLGYSEPDWKVFTYIRIRQKPKQDDRGKMIAEAGGFDIRNDILGEVPDAESVTGVILVDKLHARTRWQDDVPACKSLDGIIGINPLTGEECGQCAVCPWAKEEDRTKACKPTPILFLDEQKYGPCVVTFTVSALKPLGIFYAQLKLKAKELKLKAPMLPPHFLTVVIHAEFKKEPQPHYVPRIEITGQVSAEKLAEVKDEREGIIHSLQYGASRFVEDEIDLKHAKNAAEIEDKDSDLPF